MSEDTEHTERRSADARARAAQATRQARQKAEFILSRAYGLVRHPKQEWEQIRDEETTQAAIMAGYVAPLAAIAPIAVAMPLPPLKPSHGGNMWPSTAPAAAAAAGTGPHIKLNASAGASRLWHWAYRS